MATVTPPNPSGRLERDHTRIRHPLDRLRKYINGYVSAEAVALFALVVTLAFWAGFWSDYGVFRLFTFDWVQADQYGILRTIVLVGFLILLLAFVGFIAVTRLFKDFRDSALALVLEKRFPGILGDRLITAVELHNPKQAAKYGYSADLVAETIHEAADRVEKVPVAEVFNWKRLWMYALVLLYLSIGMYLLTLTAFAAARLAKKEPALEGIADFHEVATIWGERNILLQNVIWPRRAHVEILPFDPAYPDREPRIAKDTPAPPVRVRAWKYIIADRKAPEGWRPLTWKDLEDRSLVEGEVTAAPKTWKARDEMAGLSVDEVELKLEAFPVRVGASDEGTYRIGNPDGSQRLLMWSDLTSDRLDGLQVPELPGSWDPKAQAAVVVEGLAGAHGLTPLPVGVGVALGGRKILSLSVDQVKAAAEKAEKDPKTNKDMLAAVSMVLAHLDRLGKLRDNLDVVERVASERARRRTLRKLVVPQGVTLVYSGRRTTNTVNLQPTGNNEYIGNFGELKETIDYTVRAEDYITRSKKLHVVEQPRLDKLESEEERPAYLYYRPWKDGTLADMRGKRQTFEPVAVSLSGDATTIEVPSGTNVTLTATSSKPLLNVTVGVEKKDEKTLKVGEPQLTTDTTFTLKVPDVRREQRFHFIFEDTDNVKNRRNIIIQPRDDVAPRIREFNPDEVIRKGKEGFIISANARIPFKASVRDDHGLARVRYGCKVIPADFLTEQKILALNGVAGLPLIGRPESRLIGVAYLTVLNKVLGSTAGDDASEEQYLDLPNFEQQLRNNRLRDNRQELLEQGTVASLLAEKWPNKVPVRRLTTDFRLTPDKWTDADEDPTEPRRWVQAQDQRAPVGSDLAIWLLRHKGNPLKERDEARPQKRFIVEIRLIADDTYTEGEVDPKTKQPIPHESPSSETFTFVVVPENELLARIAEEEDAKHREMIKLVKPLADNRDRLRDVAFELSAGAVGQEVVNAMIARCDTLDKVLEDAHRDALAVKSTYERIIREMRLNQVNEALTAKKYREVYRPLELVTGDQFDRTIASLRTLRKTLDNKDVALAQRTETAKGDAQKARNELNELVRKLNEILDRMQGISDINKLIQDLRELEKQETLLLDIIRKVHKQRIGELLNPKK